MSTKSFVHKFAFPPPREASIFEDSLLILYSFSSFWALLGGGGGHKTKFCRQEFYGHRAFMNNVVSKCIKLHFQDLWHVGPLLLMWECYPHGSCSHCCYTNQQWPHLVPCMCSVSGYPQSPTDTHALQNSCSEGINPPAAQDCREKLEAN